MEIQRRLVIITSSRRRKIGDKGSNVKVLTPMDTDKGSDAMNSQFATQTTSTEDLLKSQTVGLLHLADFRKRRAEALEQKDRETQNKPLSRLGTSASSTPTVSREG